MRKSFIILSLLIVQVVPALSQGYYGQSWVLGLYGYQIKFNGTQIDHDTLNLLQATQTGFTHGNSNICNSTGDVAFISGGFNIYNKSGGIIEGGDTLVPKTYYNFYQGFSLLPQSSIFLPMDSGKIYFVTPTCSDSNLANVWLAPGSGKAPFDLLLYNIIDANANAGAGKVIKRMQPLIQGKELSKTQMMACRHGNGKDWWLLKMAGDTNKVYTFLFTQDSVYYKGTQPLPFPFRGYIDIKGQMTFNADGTQMATTYNNNYSEVWISDFDRCHGILNNHQKIFVTPDTFNFPFHPNYVDTFHNGLCYSPNGRFLYVSHFFHVTQYDLQDGSTYRVCDLDTTWDAFTGYSSLYLGPNGKIYIGNNDGLSRQMSVIDNPDVEGAGCNFCRKCLRSKTALGILTTPPCMPNYALGSKTCWPLSVMANEEPGLYDWKIYPNPADNELKLISTSNSRTVMNMEIIDQLGRVIQRTSCSACLPTSLNTSNLERGVYYLRITDAKNNKTVQSFVVSHSR